MAPASRCRDVRFGRHARAAARSRLGARARRPPAQAGHPSALDRERRGSARPVADLRTLPPDAAATVDVGHDGIFARAERVALHPEHRSSGTFHVRSFIIK